MANATTIDPPDDATGPDCSWCSNDPRTTAFCGEACESESRLANEEQPDTVDERVPDYDGELSFLARHCR